MYLLTRATLRILNTHGITVGAGFVLENHLAVTCAHVIEDAGSGPGQPVQVEFYGKTIQQTATVYKLGWADTDADDLAFLKLESIPPGIEPLQLSTSKTCGGHDFLTLGFPDWKAPDVHWPQGKLAGLTTISSSQQELLQFQGVEIVKGCSGGALLDLQTFRVVGIVSRLRKMTEVPNIGYATTAETVKKYWPALKIYEHQLSSHVRIELGNRRSFAESSSQGVMLEWNPSFQVTPTPAFQAHPAVEVPELRHLIGHRGELTEMLEAYWRAKEQGQGSVLFVTGPYGHGTKALGRAFLDVLPKNRCSTVITRFWPEELQDRTVHDPRWRNQLDDCLRDIQIGPAYIRQEPLIPLWPILAQLGKNISPADYPHDIYDLAGLLRRQASNKPLILLLEDVEHAYFSWLDLIRHMLPEIQKGLPLIFVITLHTEKNLGLYRENELLPSHRLALELTQRGEAVIFPLDRVTEEDIEAYVNLEAQGIAQKLYQLTGGIPLLIESMWQEFLHKRQVKHIGPKMIVWQTDAEWNTWGSGRDYVNKILDELYALEECPPWPKETMLEMLVLAAQEGVVFTPEAIARTFDVSSETLLDSLTDLTDGLDEDGIDLPGLVRETKPVMLLKNVECYRFQPPIVWFVLREYYASEPKKLIALAESLCDIYWPFLGKIASSLVHLYKSGGQPEKIAEYIFIQQSPDPYSGLISEATLLLREPSNPYADRRIVELISKLGELKYSHNNPSHALELFSAMFLSAKRIGLISKQALALLYKGNIVRDQGDFSRAQQMYVDALTLNRVVPE